MEHLAQMAFDHMWLILFSGEEVIDLHYSVKLLEELPSAVALFTPAEQDALAAVGQKVKDRLLAEPDEYGHTPRSRVTNEQRRFLDGVISKEIYDEEWWSNW
jgi:hypothetical protein